MIELVDRAFDEGHVALRIEVREEPPGHVLYILHIDALVDHARRAVADDPRVRAMAEVTRARVVLVGESPDAEVRATDVTLDEGGRPRFTVIAPFGTAEVSLPLVGRHHVGNALAVIAAAQACGLDLETIVAALVGARPASRWRMEVTERVDGVRVVNDAYNANPDSMAAALRALAAMSATGRRVAVLGSMLELGEESPALHRGVGELAGERFTLGLVENGGGEAAKRLLVLDHVAQSFEPGTYYPETEVNEVLRGFHDDVAMLRRHLVDEGFLDRSGGVYRRSGGSVPL